MPRPRLVPHYVNVEMPLVMNRDLPASAKVTYMYLKALSWGEDSIEFTYKEFNELFGIPRTTLYRHLTLLATSTVLRFGPPGRRTIGKVQVVFVNAFESDGGALTEISIIPKMDNSYSSSSKDRGLISFNKEEEEEDDNHLIVNPLVNSELSINGVVQNSKNGKHLSKNGISLSKIDNLHSKYGKSEDQNEIPPLASDETDSINETLSIPKEKAVSHRSRRPSTPDQDAATIFQHYEQNIGVLTPMIAEEIGDAMESYPLSWIEEVILIEITDNLTQSGEVLRSTGEPAIPLWAQLETLKSAYYLEDELDSTRWQALIDLADYLERPHTAHSIKDTYNTLLQHETQPLPQPITYDA